MHRCGGLRQRPSHVFPVAKLISGGTLDTSVTDLNQRSETLKPNKKYNIKLHKTNKLRVSPLLV